MSSFLKACLIGSVALAAVVLGGTERVAAAAPGFIVVHGPLLATPVTLNDFWINLDFELSRQARVEMTQEELANRPFLEITELWGSGWTEFFDEGGTLSEVSLEAGPPQPLSERSILWNRLYLATKSEPLILMTNRGAPDAAGFYAVGARAGRILASRGVATHVDDLAAGSATSDGAGAERVPFAGKFVLGPSLVMPRSGHSATLLQSGEILIVGGRGLDPGSAAAELLDPATQRFRLTGETTTERSAHTATLLQDGTVLIVGGETSGDDGLQGLRTAELYDPSTGQFTPVGELLAPRRGATATLLHDGRVLIAGGAHGDLPTAEIYDPATSAFTASGEMVEERQYHSAAVLPDGSVLISGGLGAERHMERRERSGAEVYDPAAGRFRAITLEALAAADQRARRLASAESAEVAVLLADGSVLFTGSYGAIIAVKSDFASVADPSSAYARPAATITTQRGGHSATLLDDGRVLIAGGRPGGAGSALDAPTLRTTEIFVPGAAPEVLPSAGSGGLADEGSGGATAWVWASAGAAMVVIAGGAVRVGRRRKGEAR